MKKRVKVEVPLSGLGADGSVITDKFKVNPPCIYCGEPVASSQKHNYLHEGTYQIKFWGRARHSGLPLLGDVVDIHANKTKGNYKISLPYCRKHIKPIKSFKIIEVLLVLIGAGLGLWAAMLAYQIGIRDGLLVLIVIAVPSLFGWLFYALGSAIKSVLKKSDPKLKDYPVKDGHYGVCTHGVRVDGGKPMKGPIRYYLQLAFCNPEVAGRFLADVPQAEVVEGRAYFGEKLPLKPE